MNVFFDTSALVSLFVSLFVRDAGSTRARRASTGAQRLVVSALAYAELLAAFARLAREGALSERDHTRAVAAFSAAWLSYQRVGLDARVLPEARRVLKFHALTGADAVHLASALVVKRQTRTLDLRFACSDTRLSTAATDEGLLAAW